MRYCLGRLPHSPEQLEATPKHLFGDILPPSILDRRNINFIPGLYKNDICPDCSAVGIVNAARAVAELNGYDLVVVEQNVLNFYASVVGCAPTLAAIEATRGAVLINVLNKQSISGFDIGSQSLVAGWKAINHTSRIALANGMNQFGSDYIGVTLYERDMETIGKTWDVVPGRDDGNVVGGHCVICFDFLGLSDSDIVRIGTWGSWQNVTWSWLYNRIDEAYVMAWRQLVRASGTYWNGMTPDILLSLTK